MPFVKIIDPVEKKGLKFSPIFSSFERSFFPLEYMQNQDLVFSYIQGGNISNLKSRRNRKNFHKTMIKEHKWKKDIKRNILM